MLFLLISAGAKAGGPKNAPQDKRDPAKFYWYKNPAPYIGKEVWTLDLGVGEEVPVSVQAMDAAGKELAACPEDWQYDGALLQVTKIQDSCKGIMLKGLNASDSSRPDRNL